MSCSSNQKTMCNNDCKECYIRSFASNHRAKYWNLDLNNGIMPHQVLNNSHQMYWFSCQECNHDFKISLNQASNKTRWCPYCGSRKLCDDKTCTFCNDRSFASHPNAIYWHSTLNEETCPRQVRKNTQKKYWFSCAECHHDFQATPNNINYGSWCIYCANLKLCNNTDCTTCFDKSLASTPKAALWHATKNGTLSPRQVFKKSTLKYWFCCNKCSHDFYNLTQYWCPFCSNNNLCSAECQTCFVKSFASHPKSKFWHKSLNGDVVPRNVFKNSNKKFWFTCDDCGLDFSSNLVNITTGNNWCFAHKNKTEKVVLQFLLDTFKDVIYQPKYDWCRSPQTNYLLAFDFCIHKHKVIVELDGPQHFRQVGNWLSPEVRQSLDIYKMKCALKHGYSVVRLLQEDVKFNKLDWQNELMEAINSSKPITYIYKFNEYDIYQTRTNKLFIVLIKH